MAKKGGPVTRLIVSSIITEELRTGGGGSGQISPDALKLLLSVVMAVRAVGGDHLAVPSSGAGVSSTGAGAGTGSTATGSSSAGAATGAGANSTAMDVHRSVGQAIVDVILGVISPSGGGTIAATTTTTTATTTTTTVTSTTAIATTAHPVGHHKGDKGQGQGQGHMDKGQSQSRMEVVSTEGSIEGPLAPVPVLPSAASPPVKFSLWQVAHSKLVLDVTCRLLRALGGGGTSSVITNTGAAGAAGAGTGAGASAAAAAAASASAKAGLASASGQGLGPIPGADDEGLVRFLVAVLGCVNWSILTPPGQGPGQGLGTGPSRLWSLDGDAGSGLGSGLGLYPRPRGSSFDRDLPMMVHPTSYPNAGPSVSSSDVTHTGGAGAGSGAGVMVGTTMICDSELFSFFADVAVATTMQVLIHPATPCHTLIHPYIHIPSRYTPLTLSTHFTTTLTINLNSLTHPPSSLLCYHQCAHEGVLLEKEFRERVASLLPSAGIAQGQGLGLGLGANTVTVHGGMGGGGGRGGHGQLAGGGVGGRGGLGRGAGKGVGVAGRGANLNIAAASSMFRCVGDGTD